MILRQFLHANPIAASYLFGCGGKAAGAVVDPVGDIGPYLRAAQDTGMRILYVIDTHIHADHLSLAQSSPAPQARLMCCSRVPTRTCHLEASTMGKCSNLEMSP